jgi:hypothetical protein
MANEFITHATNTIKEVAKTMQERGNQYTDTWGKDGCWHLTKAIVAKYTGKDLDDRAIKAIALASFCDQKYSRFAGGYKEDNAIDLIPYLGALVDVIKTE